MKTALPIACLLLLAACANEPRTVTAPESGGKVTVAHGDRLLIRLPDPAGGEWIKREPATRAVIEEWPPEAAVRRFTPVTSGTQELRFEQGSRAVTYEVTVPNEGKPLFQRP